MSLRYALLGLLADHSSSGYELARRFEQGLRQYAWHAKDSQIYPELSRLANDELIVVAEEGPRGRRTYAITEAGRAELRGWLTHPPAEPSVRNETVLRLFLLSTLDDTEARALLQWYADDTAGHVTALRSALEQSTGASKFDRMVVEFGLRHIQSTHEWALWAMDQLDS